MTNFALTPDLFYPGDFLPPIVLPDLSGAAVHLNHQSLAGDAMVLWFTDAEPDPAVLAALAARQAALAAIEARIFAVAIDRAPPQAVEGAVAGDAPVPVLCDPGGQVARGLGVKAGEGVVVDGARYFRERIPDGAYDAAVACCQGLPGGDIVAPAPTHAPVLVIENVLEPGLCQALIDYWQAGEKVDSPVAAAAGGMTTSDSALKKRTDVIVRDPALIEALQARTTRRIVPELYRSFGRQMKHHEDFRIGRYDGAEGGRFGRHRDNTTQHTGHRQVAVTLNLNTGAYDGGGLRFPEFGKAVYAPPAGGAVLFSCGLLHEAEPVTRGERFGLFNFFHDDSGQALRQRMAERRAGVRVASD